MYRPFRLIQHWSRLRRHWCLVTLMEWSQPRPWPSQRWGVPSSTSVHLSNLALEDGQRIWSRLFSEVRISQWRVDQGQTPCESFGSAPLTVVCPLNPTHRALVPLRVGAVSGCLHDDCEARHGMLAFETGEQKSLRYVCCIVCLNWGILARQSGPQDGATPRRRARCRFCQSQPLQDQETEGGRGAQRAPEYWYTSPSHPPLSLLQAFYGDETCALR